MLIIKSKFHLFLIIGFICFCFNDNLYIDQVPRISDSTIDIPRFNKKEFSKIPQISANGGEYSSYNLSVIFDPFTSSVTGKMIVNYYNNDPISFPEIPFHLFLSGMQYESRAGDIEILGVRTLSEPKIPLDYEVDDQNQLLWVDIESILGTLSPDQRAYFEIEFHAIIPDGGLDRANSHGPDGNRIYKFTSFYPMPCVYDE
ncbi:MAG: hypothetical protein KAT57_05085, partial [Candidatus Lokiarchaeota archaeon]|nr:hypothetical protein [Candidatus Lokiarchaeota archaeon]